MRQEIPTSVKETIAYRSELLLSLVLAINQKTHNLVNFSFIAGVWGSHVTLYDNGWRHGVNAMAISFYDFDSREQFQEKYNALEEYLHTNLR